MTSWLTGWSSTTSTRGFPSNAGVAGRAGMSAVLTKPVRQTRLREALVGALAGPTLPAAPSAAAPLAPVFSDARPLVLVAEDHPVNQLVIRKLLEQEGVDVDVADDGRQALDRIARRDYAAVFMDCQMPVLDGYDATRALRRDGGGDLPVIALTANAMKGDRERCLEAGMDDYLSKPIDLLELQRVLGAWVMPTSARDTAGRVASPEPGVLDPTVVARLRTDFDPDTRRRLVDLFLAHAPESVHALRQAATAGDVDALRSEAHRLKGSCLNLGADDLRKLCAAIEQAAIAGDLSAVSDEVEALDGALSRAGEALRLQLATP